MAFGARSFSSNVVAKRICSANSRSSIEGHSLVHGGLLQWQTAGIFAAMDTTFPSSSGLWRRIGHACEEFAHESVDRWIKLASDFLAAFNKHCIAGAPSPADSREIDRIHSVLLDSARVLQKQMVDFPDRDRARRVAALLWNLQESWAITHNPMNDEPLR